MSYGRKINQGLKTKNHFLVVKDPCTIRRREGSGPEESVSFVKTDQVLKDVYTITRFLLTHQPNSGRFTKRGRVPEVD